MIPALAVCWLNFLGMEPAEYLAHYFYDQYSVSAIESLFLGAERGHVPSTWTQAA